MKFITLFTVTREASGADHGITTVTYAVNGWAVFILAYFAAVCAILS